MRNRLGNCSGCGQPLHELSNGLNSCDTPSCPGFLPEPGYIKGQFRSVPQNEDWWPMNHNAQHRIIKFMRINMWIMAVNWLLLSILGIILAVKTA